MNHMMDLASLIVDHSLLLLLLLQGSDSEDLVVDKILKHGILNDQHYRKTEFGQELERYIRQHVEDIPENTIEVLTHYGIYIRVLELADSMLSLFEKSGKKPVDLIKEYENHINHLQQLNLISRLKYIIGTSNYSLKKNGKSIKEKYLTFTYYKGVRSMYGHGKRYHKMLGKFEDYEAGVEDQVAKEEAKNKYFEETLAFYDRTRPDTNNQLER